MNKILLSLFFVLTFSSCQEQDERIIVVYYQYNESVDTFYVYDKVWLYEGNLRTEPHRTIASGVRTFKYLK